MQLRALGGILGLLQREADAFLQGEMTLPLEGQEMHAEQGSVDAQHVRAYVQAQIDARAAAKKAKNFAEADRIRADLLKQGIVLEAAVSLSAVRVGDTIKWSPGAILRAHGEGVGLSRMWFDSAEKRGIEPGDPRLDP